jgi:hypothetical protein
VRIRVQAEAGLADASGILTTGLRAGLPRRLHSTPHAFAVLLAEGAAGAGLLRGVRANVLHSCCITVGTVPVYEHTKYLAKSRLGWSDGLHLHLRAGAAAGLVGTTVAAPADVVRTRIMSTAKADGGHMGIGTALRVVLRESGPAGLLRGWVPAYLRIGPLFLQPVPLIVRKHTERYGL